MLKINTVAVLGTGVMGSQIAAHCANAGLKVFAFDMSQEISEDGIEKASKIKPKALNKSLDSALAKNSVVPKKKDIVKQKSTDNTNNIYLSKSEIEKKIREIRKAMENAAKSLDFIEAAKFRDEIKILQDQL